MRSAASALAPLSARGGRIGSGPTGEPGGTSELGEQSREGGLSTMLGGRIAHGDLIGDALMAGLCVIGELGGLLEGFSI